MYTSRPEASNQLRHVATQKIEIRGFKEEQIGEYINNAFENVEDGKEKALKLTAQVKSNPSIRNILYVPINIAIICHLFLLTQFYDSFQMIWRMYCGITRLRSKDIFHYMLSSKWVESRYRKRRIIELLQCVYEAHNDEVCNVVCNHLDGNIDLSLCRLDQISCSALGYLLKEYSGALKVVQLGYCYIGDEGCMILLNSLLSRHDNSSSSKFELILHINEITDKSSLLIASLLSSNYPITKLDLRWNELSSSTDIIFESLHHNNVLTELLLGYTSLNIHSLGQILTSNNTLSVMDISSNDLGVSGTDKISKMLYHNKSITSVNLGDNRIGDEGVEKLVEHLKSNKTIKHLGLWNNNITSNGANHLSKLFSLNHTTVNSIELSYNPLEDEGVDLILQSIIITMEYVGLYRTGMTSSCSTVSTALHKIKSISFTLPDNCVGISDSLGDTTVLEELKLRDGNDTANHTMISGINRNNSIKKLVFYGGQLHHQTLSDLVEVIKVNKIITELVIVEVDVSPSDCLLLADVFTSIKEMSIYPLHKSELDQSLVLQLLKKLKYNYTLEVLTLWITRKARDDEQFIRDVEILVEDMNNIRHSHGVTTPLYVKLI